ncbi:MAG: sulfite exporter TauE/SafE family protein [Desulfobulbaceae bacterium]|nr:sulfite exporter TauE/SafE family protein [Desulfobulbaceae bacterium]
MYLIPLIFLAAGFTQGVSGFGSALVAMPLLLFFMDAHTAVPLCMLNGLIITSFLSLQLRRHVDWQKITPLLFGCMPGIYVGARFLKEADSNLIKLLLGVMLVGYSLYSLFLKPRTRKIRALWPYAAGFGTGVIGSAFSAGGPPTIIYVTLTSWEKDDIKATLSVFFFITGIFMASAHAVTGLTTRTVLGYFSLSALFVLLGVWLGSIFYGRIRRETYLRVILSLLVVMGVVMIGTSF